MTDYEKVIKKHLVEQTEYIWVGDPASMGPEATQFHLGYAMALLQLASDMCEAEMKGDPVIFDGPVL